MKWANLASIKVANNFRQEEFFYLLDKRTSETTLPNQMNTKLKMHEKIKVSQIPIYKFPHPLFHINSITMSPRHVAFIWEKY